MQRNLDRIDRLCERLLDRAAASESTSTDKDDHSEHEGKDDPANPGESGKSLGRVAVREGVVLSTAVGDTSSSVGQSSGTSEPEDPGKEERDGMTGNRGDNTADAEEEESGVDNTDEETPPTGEEEETGCVLDALCWRVVVLVVVGNERRSNHSDDESDKGEDDEGDGVATTDGSRGVDHCEC